MALHDLFAIAIQEGNRADAESFARRALAAYRPNDIRVRKLAHDVAYYWLTLGYYARALPVFEAVLAYFPEPDDAVRVLANAAHAAGGSGDRLKFREYRLAAESLVPVLETREALAPALLEMACGAAALREWSAALLLANAAGEAAKVRNESNVIIRAEALATAVAQEDAARVADVVPERRVWMTTGEGLAEELVASLERGRADGE
jgi:tetratricopeptide (TPR) repeat protein